MNFIDGLGVQSNMTQIKCKQKEHPMSKIHINPDINIFLRTQNDSCRHLTMENGVSIDLRSKFIKLMCT